MALVKHFNLRPWEIEELTVTEIGWMFKSLEEKQEEQADSVVLGPSKIANAYRNLSPKDKLDLGMCSFWY